MTSFHTSHYRSCMATSGYHARAFVLQLDPGDEPGAGRFAGRVEHVASGRSARFASPEELVEFVARVLAAPPDPADEPRA